MAVRHRRPDSVVLQFVIDNYSTIVQCCLQARQKSQFQSGAKKQRSRGKRSYSEKAAKSAAGRIAKAAACTLHQAQLAIKFWKRAQTGDTPPTVVRAVLSGKTRLSAACDGTTTDHVYLFRARRWVKIGFTKRKLAKRHAQVEAGLLPDETLELIGTIPASNGFHMERQIHQQWAHRRSKREWFRMTVAEARQVVQKYGGTLAS